MEKSQTYVIFFRSSNKISPLPGVQLVKRRTKISARKKKKKRAARGSHRTVLFLFFRALFSSPSQLTERVEEVKQNRNHFSLFFFGTKQENRGDTSRIIKRKCTGD